MSKNEHKGAAYLKLNPAGGFRPDGRRQFRHDRGRRRSACSSPIVIPGETGAGDHRLKRGHLLPMAGASHQHAAAGDAALLLSRSLTTAAGDTDPRSPPRRQDDRRALGPDRRASEGQWALFAGQPVFGARYLRLHALDLADCCPGLYDRFPGVKRLAIWCQPARRSAGS